LGIERVPLKPEQFAKAESPIDVTLFGIVSGPVRNRQPLNADAPIEVIVVGIVRVPWSMTPEKALAPIAVTGIPAKLDGMLGFVATTPLYPVTELLVPLLVKRNPDGITDF
jgi:hypothetical protein